MRLPSSVAARVRILHVLDHSIPLHSGYTFRTAAILREQRVLGWETFHLTSPKHSAPGDVEEDIEGLHFYRSRWVPKGMSRLPVAREIALMPRHQRRPPAPDWGRAGLRQPISVATGAVRLRAPRRGGWTPKWVRGARAVA